MNKLLDIIRTLRGPEGCAWDKKQDLNSLKKFLLEETYEVLETIDNLDNTNSGRSEIDHHKEELGDLLLQIVFQSEIQKEKSNFDFNQVCEAICEKLIRRHPHIFGDKENKDSFEDNPYWEDIKKQEKANKLTKNNFQNSKSILADIPKSFTALMRAQKTSQKAAKANFTWPNIKGVLADVDEEVLELKEAINSGNKAHIEHELGDAIYSLVNVARFLKIDAELATQEAVNRFHKRFQKVEEAYAFNIDNMKSASVEQLDTEWNRAKETAT